jgi:hypothetical protein
MEWINEFVCPSVGNEIWKVCALFFFSRNFDEKCDSKMTATNYPIKQSHRKSNSHSGSQEMFDIFRNLKTQYRIHKNTPLNSMLCQIILVHILKYYFLRYI